MKWFDRWFYKQARKAWENKDRYEEEGVVRDRSISKLAPAMESDSIDWHQGLNISVKRVNGGFIVNFRKYDRIKDYHHNNIHIITDEVDFNKELGKLITLESMR
jgi:hypothetical protein